MAEEERPSKRFRLPPERIAQIATLLVRDDMGESAGDLGHLAATSRYIRKVVAGPPRSETVGRTDDAGGGSPELKRVRARIDGLRTFAKTIYETALAQTLPPFDDRFRKSEPSNAQHPVFAYETRAGRTAETALCSRCASRGDGGGHSPSSFP
ncbi:hypothetical protein ACTJJ7_27600 [Phyllobacterium sp. 22229]|uniref:Uncharacterized protein n=1 Tax=Phyllobacterium myrsinacearum TaxID=28101 RepID=A0A2S9JA18_9HYPH|nr:hypothetical protein [Phyllobacterium myrsinacearum]PRD49537.1 hypothetical protein C5750_26000 [Phyllobacterium myrsinacearum]